jgi:hypothetical protein
MRKLRFGALLLVLSGIIVGLFAGMRFVGRGYWSARAEQDDLTLRRAQPRTMAGTQWEYCAITGAAVSPALPRGSYTLTYFKSGGVIPIPIEEAATERGALAKAIAKLGEDGWELVGEGPFEFKQTTHGEALFFKRLKR